MGPTPISKHIRTVVQPWAVQQIRLTGHWAPIWAVQQPRKWLWAYTLCAVVCLEGCTGTGGPAPEADSLNNTHTPAHTPLQGRSPNTTPNADTATEGVSGMQLPKHLRARVRINGLWGIISPAGEWLAQPEYENLLPYFGHRSAFIQDGRLGYLDTLGKPEIAPQFNFPGGDASMGASLVGFQSGLAVAYNQRGKCGYINTQGQYEIPAQYDQAWPFLPTGIALVKVQNRMGFINRQGQYVVQPTLTALGVTSQGTFPEGLEPVLRNGLWGYLDATGRFAIPPAYKAAGAFRNGRAWVQTDEGLAYINRKGKVVTWLDFLEARDFSAGLAAVRLPDGWTFIDTTGRVVIFSKFEYVGDFADSLAPAVQGNKWGLLNRQGNWRLAPEYDEMIWTPTRNPQPIPLRSGLVWGFAAPDGSLLVPPTYAEVRPFRNGMAAVKKRFSKWGFVSADGRLATPLLFDEVGDFSQGVAPARQDSLWGYIDAQGRWLIRPQFEAAQPFENPE